MANKDRHFTPADRAAVIGALRRRKLGALRRRKLGFDRKRHPGEWVKPAVSPDPVAGAVRAVIEITKDADAQRRLADPTPGHPPDYERLLNLLSIVEERHWHIDRLGIETETECRIRITRKLRWKLGVVPDTNAKTGYRRVGTAEKGSLVQAAAKRMHLSPARVRDLARQLADMAATLPEKMIGR